MKIKYTLRNKSLFDCDLIISHLDRVVSLLTFTDSITCIHSFIHFFVLSLSLPLFHSTGMYTYLPYRYIVIYLYVSQEKKERTFMYTYVFSYVFPLKTPRTIGSMLNVSFFYICIMYSDFFFLLFIM